MGEGSLISRRVGTTPSDSLHIILKIESENIPIFSKGLEFVGSCKDKNDLFIDINEQTLLYL